MAQADFAITDSELESLARLAGRDVGELRGELRKRPWSLSDLLADPTLVEAVLEPTSILATPGPFALFAVMVRQAADDVLDSDYVNDWVGPRSRLPVFDVAPLQELVVAPGRLLFHYRTSQSPVNEILGAVAASGLTVADMSTEETDLEDIFLQLTSGGQDTAAGGH